MGNVQIIKVEPLTEEAFEPYGEILNDKGVTPDFKGGGKSQSWSVDFEADGRVLVMASKNPFQGLAFKKMERHFSHTQTFIPLSGSPALVAVAPPTDPNNREDIPNPEQVRAFLIDGTKGYMLKRGTWHTLDRFPLYPPGAVYVVLATHENNEDLRLAYAGQGGFKLSQEVDFEAKLGVSFEMVL
mgnify:CR=1 FL=1